MRRRAEKVAARALLPLLKAKMRGVKMQVMGLKWAFSTLIPVEKVKRIDRKKDGSGRISEYPERKMQDKQDKN